MSAFGASFKVSRIDLKPIEKEEAKKIEQAMKKIAKKLKLHDATQKPFKSSFSRMDGISALFVATAADIYKTMPDDILADSFEWDMRQTKRLIFPLKKEFPKKYNYEVGTEEW